MQGVRWELIGAFFIAAAITIGSVFFFAVWIAQRFKVPWRFWLYGAAVFVLFQGILRLPWILYLQVALRETLRQSPSAFISFLAFAAFTAALFERGGQWLLFRRFIKPEDRTLPNALLIGAGHGGIEAFFIGLTIALQGINYLVMHFLPAEMLKGQEQAVAQAKQIFDQLAWWLPFMGAWERLSTQVFQITATVLVWLSLRSHWSWFLAALAAHFCADFFLVLFHRYAQQWWGMNIGSLVTEIVIMLYAAVWAYVAWRCAIARYSSPLQEPNPLEHWGTLSDSGLNT